MGSLSAHEVEDAHSDNLDARVTTLEQQMQSMADNPETVAVPGPQGKSAYEVAQDEGFTGDEAAWLASLKGERGTDGVGIKGDKGTEGNNATDAQVMSAVSTWMAAHPVQNGQDGTAGSDGAPGASAYQLALQNGFQGTVGQYLDSLRGQDGVNGQNATAAQVQAAVNTYLSLNPIRDGIDGKDGKSAYQQAVDAGYNGTVAQWLASLKGSPGANGVDGINGSNGTNGTSATVAVGSTTTLAAGSDAVVTNTGTQAAAVLNFGIPRGPQGPAGSQGPQGNAGSNGVSPDFSVGTVNTLTAGSTATVTKTGTQAAPVLNFGIPQGLQGGQGPQGPQGVKGDPGTNGTDGVSPNISVGTVTTGPAGSTAAVTKSGTQAAPVLNFAIPRGADGAAGANGTSATVAVGSVTTLTPGSQATVVNAGNSSNALLNFGIPQGAQGTAGVQGPQGIKGTDGVSPDISIGTVNNLAPGSTPTVTKTGTQAAPVFNFGIPQGVQGIQGIQGLQGVQGNVGATPVLTIGTVTTLAAGAAATASITGTPEAPVLNLGLPVRLPTVTITRSKGKAVTGTFLVGGTQTITVTLEKTMPNTTYDIDTDLSNGVQVLTMLSASVLSRTTTSVTVKITATGILSTAALLTVSTLAIVLS